MSIDGQDPADAGGMIFDDAFVEGAAVREGSAADRLPAWSRPPVPRAPTRARPAKQPRSATRPRRSRWVRPRLPRARTWPGAGKATPWLVFLTLAVIVGLLDLPADAPPAAPAWTSGGALVTAVPSQDRPVPRRADSRTPLGTPPAVAPDAGPHAFMHTQPGSSEPVAYDPCRPIHYVVNPRTQPAGADRLLSEAVAVIAQATGLVLLDEGAADEVPARRRQAYQPDRYGNRWAPVLIAWSDAAEEPKLTGLVAGTGGSQWIQLDPRDPLVYVTGMVTLDGPQLGDMLSAGRRDHALAVVVHELAHVVGLDHVNDASQLMHARGGVTQLQDGDRAGLARLGAGACIRRL